MMHLGVVVAAVAMMVVACLMGATTTTMATPVQLPGFYAVSTCANAGSTLVRANVRYTVPDGGCAVLASPLSAWGARSNQLSCANNTCSLLTYVGNATCEGTPTTVERINAACVNRNFSSVSYFATKSLLTTAYFSDERCVAELLNVGVLNEDMCSSLVDLFPTASARAFMLRRNSTTDKLTLYTYDGAADCSGTATSVAALGTTTNCTLVGTFSIKGVATPVYGRSYRGIDYAPYVPTNPPSSRAPSDASTIEAKGTWVAAVMLVAVWSAFVA